MSLAQIREELGRFREQVVQEGDRRKDSQFALGELERGYAQLSKRDRDSADHVFAEWIFSSDPVIRFLGLAMIRQLLIRSAIPRLRELAKRLALEDEPSSPYDLAWVNRIIARLELTTRGSADEPASGG